MHHFIGGLLALTLALPFVAAPSELPQEKRQAPEVELVTEKHTKIQFPVQRPADRGVERLDLTGIGLRTKTIFKVKVYAVALYVDPYGAQETVGAYTDHTADQLRGSRRFYEILCEDNFTKSLVLTFARDVGGDDVAEAFAKSVPPRLHTALYSKEMPDASADLETFKAFFDTSKFKKGSTIELTWHPDHRLTTTVDGVVKPAIESPGLCWALFDTYLGRDPIQTKIKNQLISTFPETLDVELPERPEPEAAPNEEGQDEEARDKKAR